MKKIYISQPMNNISWEDVMSTRNELINKIHNSLGNDVEIVNNIFDDYDERISLKYQIKSSWLIAESDIVYFAKGWENSRGCCLEEKMAIAYHKQIAKE